VLLCAWRTNYLALLQLVAHPPFPHTVLLALAKAGREGGREGRVPPSVLMLEEEANEEGERSVDKSMVEGEGGRGGERAQSGCDGEEEEDPLQSLACAVRELRLASQECQDGMDEEEMREGGPVEYPQPPSSPVPSSSSFASFSTSLRNTLFGGLSLSSAPVPHPVLRPSSSTIGASAAAAARVGEGGREGGKGRGLSKGHLGSRSMECLHNAPPAQDSANGRPPRPGLSGIRGGGGRRGGGGKEGGLGTRSLCTTPVAAKGVPSRLPVGGRRFWGERERGRSGRRTGERQLAKALGSFARAPGWQYFR